MGGVTGRVVVVGASLGGLAAAGALCESGQVGDVLILGEESDPPYDRPPLSKGYLAGSEGREAIGLPVPDGVAVRLGRRAVGLDLARSEVLHVDATRDGTAEAEREPFSGLVVATGSKPRTLPALSGLGPGAGVHLLRTIDDADAIRQALSAGASRLVVVGAGFIGTEVAATCRGLGVEVTLVEVDPAPLQARVGRLASSWLLDAHRAHGVELRLGQGVAGAETDSRGHVRSLRLDDGTSVSADLVVVGVGVRPAVEWLAGSGLSVDDGVLTDDRGFVPGTEGRVVAVGDLAKAPWTGPAESSSPPAPERIEHWDHAVTQGGLAGANLAAGLVDAQPFTAPGYFWTDQYGHKLQLVGRPRPGDEEKLLEGSPASGRFAVAFVRERRLAAALAVGWPAALARWQRRLGEPVDFDA
jgi:3-phenylpropionate/trans-cinnamate dioxygenase ferredoxin reductase subunit